MFHVACMYVLFLFIVCLAFTYRWDQEREFSAENEKTEKLPLLGVLILDRKLNLISRSRLGDGRSLVLEISENFENLAREQ